MRLSLCLLLGIAAAASPGTAAPRQLFRVEAVAGSGRNGDGGPAAAAQFGAIHGIAADSKGNVYLSDTDHHRVRRISAAGTVSTIAGTGVAGFSGDGGPAASAALNLPFGLALDAAGNLYIADLGNGRVRRVNPQGAISTVAGTGAKSDGSDGGLAVNAELRSPRNLVIDSAGNLYISEFEGHRIRKVSPDGRISTFAGNGNAGFGGDGGLAQWSQLAYPAGLFIDRAGNLLIADSGNGRVRRVDASGFIRTAVGGSQSTALLNPVAVASDFAGTIYVADATYCVRALTASGAWRDFAGTAVAGYSGDGGPAAGAQLASPAELAVDYPGNLLLADGVRLRAIDNTGTIRTLAGDGFLRAVGDAGPASDAILSRPSAVALDRYGNLYIADPGTRRVRHVSPAGIVGTLAGNGAAGPFREGEPAAASALSLPAGVAADSGAVLIADQDGHRLRQVGADGRITTLAGTGKPGAGKEGGSPAGTDLRSPGGVCTDRGGVIFLVDTGNHRLLRVTRNLSVQVAAGNGFAGDAGDGGEARFAQLNRPSACAADSFGNLYIADTGSHRIRRVTAAGIISTVAGTGMAGFSGDEGPAAAAELASPRGLAVDDSGNLFVADTGNHRIRLVDAGGVIRTIAGDGAAAWGGDGGPALEAHLNEPAGVLLDGAGDLYFADSGNDRVRRLVPDNGPAPDPVLEPPSFQALNAASLSDGPVAPGELLTLRGEALTGDSEVRFNGAAVPVLFVAAQQITVVAPAGIAGLKSVQVEIPGSAALTLPVAEAAPGLFPVALNSDVSINGERRGAPRGSVLVFYATGEGLHEQGKPKLELELLVGGEAAEILWAAAAPGLPGTLQIFARLPAAAPTGAAAATLRAGTAVSPPVTVWIQ